MNEWTILFPIRWQTWLNPTGYVEIIVNWLDVEVDQGKIRELPALTTLQGWRNREVYEYVRGPNSKDWTAGIL